MFVVKTLFSKDHMLKKLLFSAPIIFYLMLEGSYFFNDPDSPKRFPLVAFEVTFLFAFVYPMIAAVIVWLCEPSFCLKCWSLGVGSVLSLVLIFFLWWDVGLKIGKASDYGILIATLAYSFIVTTGLFALTGRLLIRLWLLFCYLALKFKTHNRALSHQFHL
jgi:hypothetical protein